MSHDTILILDFGSQVTQLIARRVREAHVYCEVHPCDVSDDWVRAYVKDRQLKGVILSGSHASVYEVDDRAPDAVGAAFYTDRLDHGMSVAAFVADISFSQEHANLLAPHILAGIDVV